MMLLMMAVTFRYAIGNAGFTRVERRVVVDYNGSYVWALLKFGTGRGGGAGDKKNQSSSSNGGGADVVLLCYLFAREFVK